MNCIVCNENMGNMKVCPKCQFQMILSGKEETENARKLRGDQYRTDLLGDLEVGIMTYEWDPDPANDVPKLKKEESIPFPQADPLDTESIYWIKEMFAAARGNRETELKIRIRRNLPSGREDEEEFEVKVRTDWKEISWMAGIRITKEGDLILYLGEPRKEMIEKEFFNVFLWC